MSPRKSFTDGQRSQQLELKSYSSQESVFMLKSEKRRMKPRRAYIRKVAFSAQNRDYNGSFWKTEENIAYKNFLRENLHLFARSVQQRRIMKINKMISMAVKTRSSDQCRSHHQKMLKYHGDLQSIICFIEQLQQTVQSSHIQEQDQPIISIQHLDQSQDLVQHQNKYDHSPAPKKIQISTLSKVELKQIDFIAFSCQPQNIWDSFLDLQNNDLKL